MPRIRFFLPLLASLVAALPLAAQTTSSVEGYVTQSNLPVSFIVDGRQIVLRSTTSFGAIGSNTSSTTNPLRNAVRLGAYVQVSGTSIDQFKPLVAATVLVRDDSSKKLSGTGVITHVVEPAPSPLYEADGYLVRITPATTVTFEGDLDSFKDVAENTWIHFSGKRAPDGVLVASHAQFLPARPTKFKAAKDIEIATVKTRPAGSKDAAATPEATGTVASPTDGAALQQDEQIKIGNGRWHTMPADQPLQQRVHRIGMALVPEYQRKMPDADPSKIHFRFFAVDNPKERLPICLLDGAVLISAQLVERMKNDDQVAALLADGIACNLQRQNARIVAENRALLGAEIAFDIAGAFIPGVGLASLVTGGVSAKAEIAMQEQRLRVALALMHAANFDPWQAPEAWRLAAPKKLPANLATLQYADESCYQFNILNLQYPHTAAANK